MLFNSECFAIVLGVAASKAFDNNISWLGSFDRRVAGGEKNDTFLVAAVFTFFTGAFFATFLFSLYCFLFNALQEHFIAVLCGHLDSLLHLPHLLHLPRLHLQGRAHEQHFLPHSEQQFINSIVMIRGLLLLYSDLLWAVAFS